MVALGAVTENLPETSVFFRHGPRSRLAEPDAVSLPDSFKNNLIALVLPERRLAGSVSV
jgi:hypothetical protein